MMKKRRYMVFPLIVLLLMLISTLIFLSTHVCAEDQNKTITVKINGGMEAEIDPIGRNKDGDVVTVAMTLCNKGEKTFYLSHLGPAKAQDNAGGVYTLHVPFDVSGVGYIEGNWQNINDQEKIKKIQGLTKIDPKTNATLNFTLKGAKSKGSLMSFSTVLVARSVDNLIADKTLSDEKKIKDLYLMNVSFRSIPTNDAP
jgi:hypothetical protein